VYESLSPRTAAILFSARAVAALYGIRFRRRLLVLFGWLHTRRRIQDSGCGVRDSAVNTATASPKRIFRPRTTATWLSFALRSGDCWWWMGRRWDGKGDGSRLVAGTFN